MDWTDRHCRWFHRVLSQKALLYTEMITAAALVHGDVDRLLRYSPEELPLALQLGGSDPALLARATAIAAPFGFSEINLNVGCPSDRVQSGAFGAVLMENPELVSECMAAIRAVVPDLRVSVKCRIGVDDQAPETALPRFLETVAGAGIRHFTIHARKAWLQGLSPKDNRTIPPLDYQLVAEMKRRFPELWIGINGGITTLAAAKGFLDTGLDGVMIGRAAYQSPADILLHADAEIWDCPNLTRAEDAVVAMLPYIEQERLAGERLASITRHMLGVFNGRPGARAWRRILSEGAHHKGAGPELVEHALAAVTRNAA